MIQELAVESSTLDIQALTEFYVRAIVEEHGPLFGAVVDTASCYMMPRAEMLATVNRVLTDEPNMLRGMVQHRRFLNDKAASKLLPGGLSVLRSIVACGTWLDDKAIERLPRAELATMATAIIAATQDAFPSGYLEQAVWEAATPFSLYISGVRH